MTIQEFLTSYKQADKGVASDDANQLGYRQQCPKYPLHVATLPPHGTNRKFVPIKSVSLDQLKGGKALILKADDEVLQKVQPLQQLDGKDCLTADQIAAEVRNQIKAKATGESKPSFAFDECSVFIAIGSHLTSLQSVERLMVNSKNARICLK